MQSIDDGFEIIDNKYKTMKEQLNCLKDVKVDKELTYKLIGDLFFEQSVISITQLSIIKKELNESKNFKHINDDGFTAYDLYNDITESLKTSPVNSMIDDHVKLHTLFENTFDLPNKATIIQPTVEEVAEFAQ